MWRIESRRGGLPGRRQGEANRAGEGRRKVSCRSTHSHPRHVQPRRAIHLRHFGWKGGSVSRDVEDKGWGAFVQSSNRSALARTLPRTLPSALAISPVPGSPRSRPRTMAGGFGSIHRRRRRYGRAGAICRAEPVKTSPRLGWALLRVSRGHVPRGGDIARSRGRSLLGPSQEAVGFEAQEGVAMGTASSGVRGEVIAWAVARGEQRRRMY